MKEENPEQLMPPETISEKETENTLLLLNAMLDKLITVITHFDVQTNIIIGISIAISALATSKINDPINGVAFMILGLFSIAATIIGLYAIHPPKFMRKKGQGESILYHRKITSYSSAEEYARGLAAMSNKETILKEYSLEIFNTYKYLYRPKRDLFNIARNVLVLGIIVSLIVYIF